MPMHIESHRGCGVAQAILNDLHALPCPLDGSSHLDALAATMGAGASPSPQAFGVTHPRGAGQHVVEDHETLQPASVVGPPEVVTLHCDLTSLVTRPCVTEMIMVEVHLAGPHHRDGTLQRSHEATQRPALRASGPSVVNPGFTKMKSAATRAWIFASRSSSPAMVAATHECVDRFRDLHRPMLPLMKATNPVVA